jgi:hypothetical protein
MSTILTTLEHSSFVEFVRLFRPEEGRMGVTVTFIAILELMREGLVEIVQAEPFAPIHLRAAPEKRNLRLVANNETPDQVAHAAQLGETVLEEVAAGVVPLPRGADPEGLAARVADADFVDDDDDVVEEEMDDFGLDDIKVPQVDFGKRPTVVADVAAEPVGADVSANAGVDVDLDDAGAVAGADAQVDSPNDDLADDADTPPPDEGRS